MVTPDAATVDMKAYGVHVNTKDSVISNEIYQWKNRVYFMLTLQKSLLKFNNHATSSKQGIRFWDIR